MRFEGPTLKMGSDLIGQREELTITLLADEASPDLRCKSHLIPDFYQLTYSSAHIRPARHVKLQVS
jgi:hypothetical protein